MDMIRTAVNVSGDAAVSTIVAKSEGKIDISVYEDPTAGRINTADSVHIDGRVGSELADLVEATHSRE